MKFAAYKRRAKSALWLPSAIEHLRIVNGMVRTKECCTIKGSNGGEKGVLDVGDTVLWDAVYLRRPKSTSTTSPSDAEHFFDPNASVPEDGLQGIRDESDSEDHAFENDICIFNDLLKSPDVDMDEVFDMPAKEHWQRVLDAHVWDNGTFSLHTDLARVCVAGRDGVDAALRKNLTKAEHVVFQQADSLATFYVIVPAGSGRLSRLNAKEFTL
ncbi:hypothetical protein DFS34DRAFT_645260 [Phlyctochytrium arcticum]|nr:hypothetical protein DFS34DRAFT_645260 [Phlyctochytrium arcticum]